MKDFKFRRTLEQQLSVPGNQVLRWKELQLFLEPESKPRKDRCPILTF